MNKTIMNIAAVNVIAWYTQDGTQEKLKKLPLKMQWVIRKNMRILEPLSKEFTDFRDELVQKRNDEWFVEDNGKCEKVTKDDQELLKIKEEYMDEFKEYEDSLNQQLNEIAIEENDVDLIPIILDDFVEAADAANSGIDIDDLDMLSVFEEEIA